MATTLGNAQRLFDVCAEKAEVFYEETVAQIRTGFQNTTQMIDPRQRRSIKDDVRMKGSFREDVDSTKAMRILARNERLHQGRLQDIERDYAEVKTRLQQESVVHEKNLATGWQEKEARFHAEYETQWAALEKVR